MPASQGHPLECFHAHIHHNVVGFFTPILARVSGSKVPCSGNQGQICFTNSKIFCICCCSTSALLAFKVSLSKCSISWLFPCPVSTITYNILLPIFSLTALHFLFWALSSHWDVHHFITSVFKPQCPGHHLPQFCWFTWSVLERRGVDWGKNRRETEDRVGRAFQWIPNLPDVYFS